MKRSDMLNMFTVASLFAGVGGLDLGFEMTGKFKTVWANEFDVKAAQTYKSNFHNDLVVGDIRNIDVKKIPDFDVLLSGFPCQAFSIAGYQKGFEDDRGDLFFETLRIIKQKKPKTILLENVKNLVSHDNGNTFKVIREALETHGYYLKYQVLNAREYANIPQNRERIYIVGFKDKKAFENFAFPDPIKLEKKLKDIIDFDKKTDDKYYYTKEKNSFYDELEKNIVNQDTVYQWRRQYVRENKHGVVPTLTANMGTGGHNVPLVKTNQGIRKMTPRECFNAQGFPIDFKIPNIADSHLYKQAGNSVVVPLVKRIADSISESLNKVYI